MQTVKRGETLKKCGRADIVRTRDPARVRKPPAKRARSYCDFVIAPPFGSTRSVQHLGAMQIGDSPDISHRTIPGTSPATLILLVEDDFVLRSSLSELLGNEGFRVESCADGREAYHRLHRQPKPDLMILDIMLPYLDGFELRALQRKSPLIANIPVVVISAYDLDPQSVAELGLAPPFRKPLDVDGLLSRIRDLMNGVET